MGVDVLRSTLDVFHRDLFKGKVLFATGGSSGIGLGQVEAMMRHGADAAICGRREKLAVEVAASLSEKTGRKCIGMPADVRKPESLKAAVEQTIKTFGRIDFVLCAAAGNFLSPIEGTSENAFKTVVEIDLLGTYNTVKATMEQVKKTRGVYLHDSMTLHYTGLPMLAHSSAAKAGVDALSRVMAVELAPFGVRSNTIAPGAIKGTEGAARLVMGDEEELARAIPAQRMGELEDIASVTVFLFSPAANYINGVELVVDGGAWHLGSLGMSAQLYPDMLQPEIYKQIRQSKM